MAALKVALFAALGLPHDRSAKAAATAAADLSLEMRLLCDMIEERG
jgi:hypothetical protein